MFIVSEFEEVVKVQPTHLEDDQMSRIIIHLNSMLANKVVMDVGLCLSLFDILEIGDSIIYPSEGAYFSKVRFRFIVFRPFVEEILIGKVKSSSSEGAVLTTGFFEDIFVPAANMQNPSRFDAKDKVWVWEYDNCGDTVELHMDIGETVRFRVVSEQFVDTHPGVDSGLLDTGEIATSKSKSPYSIVGTVREPGLGVIGWWTDL
ncbi:DNA-directed RNA polymerase III subunit RPC8 [Metopolophium dirhodum]|uniref:DNA-directed RNA polymerase III subunit RPC8 n=1 Tax=Metopolophium dirhodum TaxID=44670 RepID=UPI002990789F|nr:DNA-directed RNA polymerase III subunit RPC8 [Metopolophium dirhodum]XP_060869355.1 DNA-directed RNA polymerase III subunit RPC8 [Metopolophium dirhodum]XP_060869356.1 DNA-directed RNA polymerase III subunit RPC8 [Metopolophium dirhodum]XP_060869357.1 DNA-directed RNA polymerase III subunit RPC8 [Metopolophium dirhodum]